MKIVFIDQYEVLVLEDRSLEGFKMALLNLVSQEYG